MTYSQEYTQKLTLETNLFYLEISNEKTANVIALGTTPLDEYIDVIEKVLSIYDHDMVVNFDLLLKNGITKRYYSTIFVQEKGMITTPLSKEVPPERDIDIMNIFLLKSSHLLESPFVIGDSDFVENILCPSIKETSCLHIDRLKEKDSDILKYITESKYTMKVDHGKDFFIYPENWC